MSRLRTLALALTVAVAAAIEASAQQGTASGAAAGRPQYHVVELYNSDSVTLEQVLGAFEKLGATQEKVMPLIESIDKNGKAVVVAGSLESCQKAAELFHEIGMKTEVRLLTKEDMSGPSEYDDSDVLVASGETLNELIGTGEGFLINFYAPWCGHCKNMVPAYKEAATALKEDGIRLVAMDGQAYPQIARQLGVVGYPALKWLKMEGESIVVAEYQGGRDAASLIRFAKAASKANLQQKEASGSTSSAETTETAKTAAAEESAQAPVSSADGAQAGSKLGQSKLAGSKMAQGETESAAGGVQKASMPAEATAQAAA